MSRLVLLVIVMIAATPTLAFPCGNEVELSTNEVVKLLVKAERELDLGLPQKARVTVRRVTDTHHFVLPRRRVGGDALLRRRKDIEALIVLREGGDRERLAAVVSHFEERTADSTKNLRLQAWLAEAYAATGELDEARTILVDLKQRDLMPDAFAYLSLARLSSGTERADAAVACQRRAKAKTVCRLPEATTETSRG